MGLMKTLQCAYLSDVTKQRKGREIFKEKVAGEAQQVVAVTGRRRAPSEKALIPFHLFNEVSYCDTVQKCAILIAVKSRLGSVAFGSLFLDFKMQRLPSNVQTCYNSYVFLTVVVLYVLLGVHGNPGVHGSKRVGKRYMEAYRSGHNENDSKSFCP